MKCVSVLHHAGFSEVESGKYAGVFGDATMWPMSRGLDTGPLGTTVSEMYVYVSFFFFLLFG